MTNPFGSTYACSVDPTTDKLAAISVDGVAVFRRGQNHRWRLPKLYEPGSNLRGGAYDSTGDLFVDGGTSGSSGFFLTELSSGASKFRRVSLDQGISVPGSLQWDGQDLAVGDEYNTLIHRFAIDGSQGRQVGSLTLNGAALIDQFWIQGDTIIGPDVENNAVEFWSYPAGGTMLKKIDANMPRGATVSVPR